jgi:hypothetical protein
MSLPKILLFAVAFIGLLNGCSQHDTIPVSGDLYFPVMRSLDLKSGYGIDRKLSDKIIAQYEKDLRRPAGRRESTEEALSRYVQLKKHDLLYAPYIELIGSDNSIRTIYLTQEDYDRIKIHRYRDLIAAGQKLHVEADAVRLDSRGFNCMAITVLQLEPGKTQPREGKFVIGDYPD